ncbi:MAG TPA: phenylalanine--tRNA ligase subunit beta [Polyangiaceae bacterium]|jgi:phenylalanyl-tRNA synthetase beta chain
MKASIQWLRALVPQLADPAKHPAKEIAARFTQGGLEVEAVHEYGAGSEACIVVQVVSMRPHPSRSGLNLVTVDRGGGAASLEVVCGAPNVPPPGGLVLLAPLGAHLPAKGMTIERRAIGGVTSEGMLCSEQELGLTDAGEGILVLAPGSAKPGDRFTDVVPSARDTVLEIGLGPNRPDGLGHIGLAREIAALYGFPFETPRASAPSRVAPGLTIDKLATVKVDDTERCPHYGANAVVDVTIGPSPLWLRYRLASLGVRSISNVVDITNLVMLEYGHPMHAFDLDRVRGGKIGVRRAKEGERLTTLDGVERTLTTDDLVITDGEGPVGLAGVMGAANSEIRSETKRVLFECAYFDPRGVRRASRRHGLHTDASHRFERGVDPGDVAEVLAHAASLATELAGGSAVSGDIHTRTVPLQRAVVPLRASRLEHLLGVAVPWKEAVAILERLGCEATPKGDVAADFTVPTHRPDISREIDLIEEVGRVRGFEAIPAVLPAIHPTREGATREDLAARARAAAVSLGLGEAVTYGFVDEASLQKIGAPAPAVRVKNPLNENQAVMRTSLLPGLLRAGDLAARRGERDARLFTVGSLFLDGHGKYGKLPEERPALAALITGEQRAWLAKPRPVDVWDGKGLASGLVERLVRREPTIAAFQAQASDSPRLVDRPAHLHPRGAASVSLEGRPVGRFGLLHPDVRDALGLEIAGEVVVLELDLAAIDEVAGRTLPTYRPIPRFPASGRDCAFVVKESVAAGEVEEAVRQAAGELAEEVRLFDRFVGEPVPTGHANLAFHVVYRRPDRTLTDAEVDAQHAKVVSVVTARFGATLRA